MAQADEVLADEEDYCGRVRNFVKATSQEPLPGTLRSYCQMLVTGRMAR